MTTEINLLPEAERQRHQIKKALLSFSSNFAAIVIPALGIICLLAVAFNATSYLRIKAAEKSFQEVVADYQLRGKTENDLRYFQQKSRALREINGERRTYSKLLEAISTLIPKSVSFYQLQVSTESIRISAQTQSINGFATLVSNLLESKKFKEVILTESEYLPADKYYRIALEIPLISESLFK